MSDANIPALLEELWEVDFETWKDIMFLLSNSMMFHEPREIPLEQHIYHDIIQGCIQRVIAAHSHEYMAEWFWEVAYEDHGRYEAKIYRREGLVTKEIADTPAAAILAAYIEAKRARQ